MKQGYGLSSAEFRKLWRYDVETDFHPIDVGTTTENKRTLLEYGTEDRFIPFHHRPDRSSFSKASSVNVDRNLLAIVDNCNVDIYSLETGGRRVLSGHTARVGTVGFSPTDSDLLVSHAVVREISSSSDNIKEVDEIIIWNLSDFPDGSDKGVLDVDGVTESGVLAVTEGLGGTLMLTSDEENEMRTTLRKMISRFETYHKIPASARLNGRISTSFQSPLFSNSGRHLIYLPGSRPKSNGDDTWDISLRDLHDGTTTILSGHRDAIMWIGFSPDDSLVASAGWDGSFRVHRLSGEEIWRWETDRQNWTGVFSPDGLYFAGGDGAGIIRVWDLRTGLEKAKVDFCRGWCRMLDWSPDGRYLAAGDEELGRIGLYTVVDGKLNLIQQRKLSLDKCQLQNIDTTTRRMMSRFLSVHSLHFLKTDEPGPLLSHSVTLDEGAEVFDFGTGEGWRFIPKPYEDGTSSQAFSQDGDASIMSTFWNESTREFGVISADGVRFWPIPEENM